MVLPGLRRRKSRFRPEGLLTDCCAMRLDQMHRVTSARLLSCKQHGPARGFLPAPVRRSPHRLIEVRPHRCEHRVPCEYGKIRLPVSTTRVTACLALLLPDRKRAASGTTVSVRVDPGGRSILETTKTQI